MDTRIEHKQMRRTALNAALTSLLLWFGTSASANKAPQSFDACFDIHGRTYGVDPELLRALARTESSMRPQAMNLSHESQTGSVDVGLMQINSRWLPKLAKHGIDRKALHEPCTNIEVGAWILSDLLRTKGNSWDAVGAWNAACTQLKGDACKKARATFAWKVHRNLRRTSAYADSAASNRATQPPAKPTVTLIRMTDLRVATRTQ